MGKRGRKPAVTPDGKLKVCGRCGEAKLPTSDFWHKGDGAFGFQTPCKACVDSLYVPRVSPCRKCGKELVGSGARYCGPDCQFDKIACLCCGELFHVTHKGARFCGMVCSQRYQRLVRKTPTVKCQGCGCEFIPKRSRYSQFHSRECAWGHSDSAYQKRTAFEDYPDRRRRRWLQQAKRGVRPTVAQIVERDGGNCHLCDHPVDLTLKAPDKMSPSIDHVTPISKGGLDVLENVRLAHYGCNASRGARDLDPELKWNLFSRMWERQEVLAVA